MKLYNQLLKKIILPVGTLLLGSSYLKHLKQIRKIEKKSGEELKELQQKNLDKILKYAIENVPYYRGKSYETLEDFPVLTKDIIWNYKDQLVSKEYDISKLERHYSSGSTGKQSATYMTRDHGFFLRALQTHWWTWGGFDIGDRVLQFGMAPKRGFIRGVKDFFYRTTYVIAFGLRDADFDEVVYRVAKIKNLVISGYPTSINEFARAVIRTNVKLSVKTVICFGERVIERHHQNFAKAFGTGTHAKLIDTYGCAEGIYMACIKDNSYYYIMSPYVFLEIVNNKGEPVKDGEIGSVLVTCLTNYAMPLIRYRLGDLAVKLPENEYPENLEKNYPLLKTIVGRETEIIRTSGPINLNVHSFTRIFAYYQDIKQYKVIQDRFEEVIVEYIDDVNTSEEPEYLEEILFKLGEISNNTLKVTFKRVKEIKPMKSGKPQIIESNLNQNRFPV